MTKTSFVKASKYLTKFDTDELKDIAHRAGIVPVNDVLLPFMDDESKIALLYGGRGGGKSNTIALRLIKECAESSYFKCFYGRKILDRVRESQHKELIKSIYQLNLQDEFTFYDTPKGSLHIIHNATGNTFIAFGGDNPQSMKSISDPTHIWADEFDQFEEGDFKALYPTLRTTRGKNQFIGSFNSYEITKAHWLVKYFFPDIYEGDEQYDYSALEGVEISRYLVNFSDNYFIDREEYYKVLKISAAGDAEKLEGLARGEWGSNRTGNEYYHAFRKSLHVKKIAKRSGVPDHLSLDFNVHPYMPLICANIEITDTEMNFNFFKEYCFKEPLNSTKEVCKAYLSEFGNLATDIFYYGDAQGNRKIEGFGDKITRFDDLRSVLARHLTNYSDRTTRVNPPVMKRRQLMNSIFAGICHFQNRKVNIYFDEKMSQTITDFQMCKVGVDGKDKSKVKDKARGITYEKYGHTSDAVEYFVCKILETLV